MRRAHFRSREQLVHVRLQFAVPLGARQLANDVAGKALDEIRLIRHDPRAERRALDAEALEQERAEIDLLELAPAEPSLTMRPSGASEAMLLFQCDAPRTSITTSAPCPPVARSTSMAKSCVL
jgi:hypothetical protein